MRYIEMAHKVLPLPTSGANTNLIYGTDWNKLINSLQGVNGNDPFTLNVDWHTIKHSTTNVAGDFLINDGTRFSRYAGGLIDTHISPSASIVWSKISKSASDITALTGQSLVSPEFKMTGFAIPSTSVTSASLMDLNGALAGLTQTAAGTSTHTLDTTEGLVSNYVSTATGNLNIGLTTAATANNITTPAFNPVLKARFKIDSTTSSRMWIGFLDGAVAVSDTPIASGVSGVLFGFSSADTVFSVRSNDNSGAATTTAMTGITKDALWHTVKISVTSINATVVLDNCRKRERCIGRRS
jgi:hypothetical protein